MKTKQPGFVLVMALFVIALGSIFVTSLLQRAVSYDRLHRVLLKQQQARMLALNGIEIARAQLSNPLTLEKEKNPVDQNIVPFLYVDQVQTFSLTTDKEGLNGEIKLFITSEEGKINLNKLYNFEEKKYLVDKDNDAQKNIALLNEPIHKNFGIENFDQILNQLLQKKPLEDVTQLINKTFKGTLFKDLDAVEKGQVALTDLFTLASPNNQLQPLYLSNSLSNILQLEKQELSKEKRLEIVKKMGALKGQIQWQQQWKELLAPLYKKEYTGIPDVIKKSLASKIETTAFLVISYGKVDGGHSTQVVQKVCAYLEKVNIPETKTILYTVKRLYWL
jgi:type II secretory pathway pseudopilin PulG